MKKSLFALLGTIGLAFSLTAEAQTADDIINKHIDAIGGKDKLSQVQSIVIDGTMQIMGGSNPFHTSIVTGKGYKNEMEFNGTKMVQCITDKGGWAINPMTGSSDPAPMADEEYTSQKDNIYPGGPLFDYAAKGSKAELLANEKLGDVDAYKIKLTNAAGAEYTFYIDPKSYYILKMVRTSNAGEMSVVYSDYRKTDYGTVYAFANEITLPQGFTLTSAIDKVVFNSQVSPEIFTMGK